MGVTHPFIISKSNREAVVKMRIYVNKYVLHLYTMRASPYLKVRLFYFQAAELKILDIGSYCENLYGRDPIPKLGTNGTRLFRESIKIYRQKLTSLDVGCQSINLLKWYKEHPMREQKEVAQDIIEDVPEKTTQNVENANSGNQEQNQQDLSESQRPDKPLNDLGNAERFVEQNGDRVRYCPELNCWFVYVDGLWIQDTGKLMYLMAKNTIDSNP